MHTIELLATATEVEVEHIDRSPVMILGHGRSGTSLLQGLLRKHLRISSGTESQFIPRYYYRLPGYGDLSDGDNLRRLVSDVSKERWFERTRKFGFVTSADAIVEDVREKSFRGVLNAIFGQLSRHQRMVRWADKTPEYVYHLPVLGSVFPDARYIHIVRDGRDVALSVFAESWGPKNTTTAALEWVHSIELTRAFATTLPASQFMEVRYEDLLSRPVEVFGRLIEFLRIPDHDKLLAHIESRIATDLKSGNFNKWKSAMSRKDITRFDSLAGYLLAHYGYETSGAHHRKAGRLETACWELDSRFRRWLRPATYRDNMYKLSLALRRLSNLKPR
jgi:Sulfotransferase family